MSSLLATESWPTVGEVGNSASGGITTAGIAAAMPGLIARTPLQPDYILVNAGANDLVAMPSQAALEVSIASMLDRLHAAWSKAQILVMRPWRRGQAAAADLYAAYIGNVLASRGPWAALGPDERVFLENGDDGATFTSDGVHPTAAGYALTAQQWKAAMGY